MDPTPGPAVVLTGLSRRFKSLTAVDELSFAVKPGSIFGLLGSNGAGKTTVIKMLTTLLPPTLGTAAVAGFDVVREPEEVRRHIGYVSQMLSSDGELTGYENMLISAKLYGLSAAERRKRIVQSLDFMDLSDAADRLVGQYSGGMIRRLEIAQSMLHRPAVLFLDEPTVGLDPVARQGVWRHIRQLRDEFGTTVFMTTHDMDEADHLCETVAFMHRGRLAGFGTPAELKAEVGPHATLDDVFIEMTGSAAGEAGSYREVRRVRRTAARLE
ncbi:MAG TPA: ATP-binding cassette domain-containing protein [Burkholderiales bacterium]|nr:ATP-binding cassette domain-containing protein [Burkholderiales bacterium]